HLTHAALAQLFKNPIAADSLARHGIASAIKTREARAILIAVGLKTPASEAGPVHFTSRLYRDPAGWPNRPPIAVGWAIPIKRDGRLASTPLPETCRSEPKLTICRFSPTLLLT